MAKMTLTMAIERYDRHFPFFDGTVTPPDGVDLKVLQVGQSVTLRDGKERHGRMLHDGEFDICEFSMSTYLMAKQRDMAITAVPVFPRRLFSQSQMYVHPLSDLWEPKDLIGKRVALSSFQTTLSLLAKGDLKFEYGVAWEDIHWCVTTAEKVDFKTKDGVVIESIGDRAELGTMLEKGEIDAFFLPHPPPSVLSGERRARRLFADTRQEELRYYHKYGYYPIMHVIAVRPDLLASEPWLAKAIIDMFAEAKKISESYYDDPNWSRLAWGRHYVEDERELLPDDLWPLGLARNRANIERLIEYAFDQNLIEEKFSAERLFAEETLDT